MEVQETDGLVHISVPLMTVLKEILAKADKAAAKSSEWTTPHMPHPTRVEAVQRQIAVMEMGEVEMTELNKKQEWLIGLVDLGNTSDAIKLIYTMTLRELGAVENWLDANRKHTHWCDIIWCSSLEVSAAFEILWAAQYLLPEDQRSDDVDLPKEDELNFDDPISCHACFLPHDLASGQRLIGGV